MLVNFSVANYRSFNEMQTLSFRATPLVSENRAVDQRNITHQGDINLLKIAGIYGANGSGKSNVIEAFQCFTGMVVNSLEIDELSFLTLNPFMFATEQKNAGYFQVVILLGVEKYRYGFTLEPSGAIKSEWLFGPAEMKETYYFKREGQQITINADRFKEGIGIPMDKLKENCLFLTFCTSYDVKVSSRIRDYFKNHVSFEGKTRYPHYFLDRPGARGKRATDELVLQGDKSTVLEWLKEAGMAYQDIEIDQARSERSTRNLVWLSKHRFDLNGNVVGKSVLNLDKDESEGSKKYYGYIGLLLKKFTEGGILVSDEIDNNFHPTLLMKLISLFQNPTVNKAQAQLLFTSHDTNLMSPDYMRRDQFYFAEKSLYEDTKLYSLADLKGIRNNVDFARQYLAGFYGALPILSNYLEPEHKPADRD